MFIVTIILFCLGVLVGLKLETFTNKSKDDWEIYDTVTGKWNIKTPKGDDIESKYAWYEIYYSPSKDYYRLEMGGYNPQEHTTYQDVVKVLRENNEAARVRKEPFAPDKLAYSLKKDSEEPVDHDKERDVKKGKGRRDS